MVSFNKMRYAGIGDRLVKWREGASIQSFIQQTCIEGSSRERWIEDPGDMFLSNTD